MDKYNGKKCATSCKAASFDERTQARYGVRAHVLKALAHPARLFIVDQLNQRERCVCELREMIGLDMSTVSKHLSVLKGAGIVADDKRGASVYYRLKMPCVLDFLGCVETVLRQTAQEQLDLAGRK